MTQHDYDNASTIVLLWKRSGKAGEDIGACVERAFVSVFLNHDNKFNVGAFQKACAV